MRPPVPVLLARRLWHHRPLLALLAVVAGAWGLFAEVAHELQEDRRQPDHGFPFDRPLLNYLHQHAGHGRCAVAGQLSALGGPVWLAAYALAAGALVWLLYRRRYRPLLFGVGAVGGTLALNLLAKYHFDRLRPNFYHQVCFALPVTLPNPSFLSGHAMASLALGCVLGLGCRRTRWRWPAWVLGLGFAGSVAWSRLYLAAHYPSDVLAGWLVTTAWVGTLYLAFSRYAPTLLRLLRRPR